MTRRTIPETRYKVTVMGDQYCGKTSIIERYVRNRFSTNYLQTQAAYDKKEITIDGSKLTLIIFDTAGQADLKSSIEIVFRHSHGILLVFDFARKTTLNHIDDWLKLIKMKCLQNTEVVLLGNKIDLPETHREITTEEAVMVGQKHEIQFLEGSAKNNYNIDEAFEILAKRIHQVNLRTTKDDIIDLQSNTKSLSKTCCN